jgi:hypothetical protein
MHFFLERPPVDHGERWSIPLRSYQVVFPPQPVNSDPVATREAKTEFLEKLWNAQAMLRTKGGRSVALKSEELEVDSRGIRTTYATTFYNVYQRTQYLGEPRKVGSCTVWHGNLHTDLVMLAQSRRSHRWHRKASRSTALWHKWFPVCHYTTATNGRANVSLRCVV